MNVLSIIELVISLLEGVSTAFNKTGLAELAAGINQAVEKLQEVQSTAVTKSQLEGMRVTPQW